MARRPLSPHLSIYRFGYTMTLSILHRITGMGLSVGLLLLTAFVIALASGADAWQRFAALLPAIGWKLIAAPFVIAFVYHFANGIRHLCWDAGLGYERREAKRSAAIVIVATLLVAALALFALVRIGGAT